MIWKYISVHKLITNLLDKSCFWESMAVSVFKKHGRLNLRMLEDKSLLLRLLVSLWCLHEAQDQFKSPLGLVGGQREEIVVIWTPFRLISNLLSYAHYRCYHTAVIWCYDCTGPGSRNVYSATKIPLKGILPSMPAPYVEQNS